MKKLSCTFGLLTLCLFGYSQTLYVPSGTNGIGTSTNGNVGIGTITPLKTLDVRGSVEFTSEYTNPTYHAFLIYNNSRTQQLFRVQENGRVGIGTKYPLQTLDVRGSVEFTSEYTNPTYHAFLIYNNNRTQQLFRVQENGRVGIGTKYPLQTLDVRGSVEITSEYTNPTYHAFLIYNSSRTQRLFRVQENGNVGIGTNYPDYKLDVYGTISASEIKVEAKPADYVFEEDYNLRSIEEVEIFVKKNKHLPEIASAKEMEKNGIYQSEMNQKLLLKIEELTLYMIEQNKETKSMKIQLDKLAKENEVLKVKITKMETTQ